MTVSRLNRFLKIPVRAWRRLISPCLPPACRFYPSCSAYALEALDRHPWPRALGLIFWRLLRCNPFCAGGYDPVPPSGHANDEKGSCGSHKSHEPHKSYEAHKT